MTFDRGKTKVLVAVTTRTNIQKKHGQNRDKKSQSYNGSLSESRYLFVFVAGATRLELATSGVTAAGVLNDVNVLRDITAKFGLMAP